ncbi:MAG: class I SAM-dependent methyltransferase [Atopobiaceae bacterium]|nr:class I SAM-dependent methyltransferase [Atopobiaceae bacterium]
MDLQTARRMSDLTTSFYAQVSASFSATRQAPWPGWQRVANHAWGHEGNAASVLDLACGNLRFARFAQSRCPDVRVWAVDNCDDLLRTGPNVRYQHLDIAHVLLDEVDLARAIKAPACDLCVCFGFMHHVPLPQHRAAVVRALVDHAAPGGIVAISFWQFERDARIMAKAQPLSDPGDYLLGWQDRRDVRRYCHSFGEDEIDLLAQAVAAQTQEVERFSADGKTGDLNRYLILRRT